MSAPLSPDRLQYTQDLGNALNDALLHWQRSDFSPEACIRLINKGAALDIPFGEYKSYYPLDVAIRGCGHEGLALAIVKSGRPYGLKEAKVPFLPAAAMRGDMDSVVAALLDDGADIQQKDLGGKSALSCAVLFGKESTAVLLLSRGADVNAVESEGMTPLAIALSRNYPDLARRLIDAGAKTTRADDSGTSIYDYAKALGDAELIRLVLKESLLQAEDLSLRAPVELPAKIAFKTRQPQRTTS